MTYSSNISIYHLIYLNRHETDEELSRDEERDAIMKKMQLVFSEGSKVFDPRLAYNHPKRF
jgi:hypothetical protein